MVLRKLSIGLIHVVLMAMSIKAFSIDPLFSQFYANPLYLNPAFAGTEKCTRMILNYRNQPYPSFGTFSTYSFSIDAYIESLSGGLGLNIIHDNQAGIINNTHAAVNYAFHGQLSRTWHINFGVQAAYINYNLNWNNLIFPDQYQAGSPTLSGSLETPGENINIHLADFSSGILLYNDRFYGGISVYHLTQPGKEFIIEQPLPVKYTVHLGYEFSPGRSDFRRQNTNEISISPSFIFQSQADFSRLNYGLYLGLSPIITGLWYRHDLRHPNSLIFLLGIKQANYRIGYSYDYSLSGFSGNIGGAHEISVLRNFNCAGRNTKYRIINCPTF